jgi:hypothetical protein
MCIKEVLQPIGQLLFGSAPKVPDPIIIAPPPVPETPDEASEEASVNARKKVAALAKLGRSSTNPTGGLGVLGSANVSRPTLLGS